LSKINTGSIPLILLNFAIQKKKAEKKYKNQEQKFGGTFNQWDSWRQADGYLCRNDTDCSWMDEDLRCESYDVSILDKTRKSINPNWFGGHPMSLKGECHCRRMGQIWNDQELVCAGVARLLVGLAPLVVGFLFIMNQI